MKHLTALILALFLSFNAVLGVSAQAAETIWMETGQQSYNTGDTITITIKANSATPIQGFSFQLRYDPACLQPVTPTSLLPGLNYMSVPQNAGLVDAIFASTTPLNANGNLAQVQFTVLSVCQTSVIMEKAGLAVLDASRMAVPLQGISLGASNLTFNEGGAAAIPTNAPAAKPTNPGDSSNPTTAPDTNPTPANPPAPNGSLNGLFVPIAILLGLLFLAALLIVLGFLFRSNRQPSGNTAAPARRIPALFIKRGPQAGTTLPLIRFPCRIGSDPENEICLNDARISPSHAEIFADQSGYSVVDLGSREGTYLNGKIIHGQQTRLRAGDVLRLGGVLLVFGPV